MAHADNESKIHELCFDEHGATHNLTWSCKTKSALDEFFSADYGSQIFSDEYDFTFNLYGTNIKTTWYLRIWPNGYDISQKNPRNEAVFSIVLAKLPSNKHFRLKSISITRKIAIPQIKFYHRSGSIKYHKSDDCNVFRAYPKLHKLSKLRNINNNTTNGTNAISTNINNEIGFDVNISFTIESIQFEKRSNMDLNFQKYYNMFGKMDNFSNSTDLNQINKRLDGIESTMQQILDKINNIDQRLRLKNADDDMNDCKENYDGSKAEELQKWILSIFKNDIMKGTEYVYIIMNKTGFYSIDIFAKSNENELKEIGIVNKRDRDRFMERIEEYNSNKEKLLLNDIDAEGQ